ncbi:MAG: nickel transporter [Burkholderiales bacterium]
MQDPSFNWYALCAATVLLGLKHGFDADHLAAIDALTRLNLTQRARLSRYCGALFSLGHGTVVVAIAVAASLAGNHWQPPLWLDPVGGWISVGLLTILGLLNLQAVASSGSGDMVRLVGLKAALFSRALRAQTPAGVAMVGMLFAVSFDTLTQALLFSSSAMRSGGIGEAILLGLLFTTGMLITDGLNGLWVARLLARADRTAARVSRLMGLAVGGITLSIAAFSALELSSQRVSAWTDATGMALGVTVLVAMSASYLITRHVGRRSCVESGYPGQANEGSH